MVAPIILPVRVYTRVSITVEACVQCSFVSSVDSVPLKPFTPYRMAWPKKGATSSGRRTRRGTDLRCFLVLSLTLVCVEMGNPDVIVSTFIGLGVISGGCQGCQGMRNFPLNGEFSSLVVVSLIEILDRSGIGFSNLHQSSPIFKTPA